MANTITPAALSAELQRTLEQYQNMVVDEVNAAGEAAAKSLVKKTKATAPKRSGSFRKNITYKETVNTLGAKSYTWGVRAPDYRLTHLLVHGHPDVNGNPVPGNPFLHNALDSVLPEYERAVEEAVRNV